jgi:solute carrier family 25 carnitine/acylcarnitine transporter 20/29
MTDATVINTKKQLLPRGVIDTLSGTAGGWALVLVGHPFDTIKVRLQTSKQYSGMVDCIKQTVAKEGVRGLYKGMISPLTGITFVNSVQFSMYMQGIYFFQNMVNKGSDERLPIGYVCLAGAIAGIPQSLVESPQDLLKGKMQVQKADNKLYSSTLDCGKKIVSQYGIRGVYQGLGATIFRNIPANFGYFGVYELSKRWFADNGSSEKRAVKDLKPHEILLSGGMGGIACWVASYPMDVIKSLMQTDHVDKTKRVYPTIIETAKRVYQQQGPKAFFRGFSPCIVRAFPANGACFFAYEFAKSMLEKL